jgi:ribonuclease BN (tRNA processing enzyme)
MNDRTFGRRGVVRGGLAATGALVAGAALPPSASASGATSAAGVPATGTQLVLLGTAAGPIPFKGRTGISSALVVDGATYVIDLGHGSFDQFRAAGLSPASLRSVFVTHLHSDHLADLYTMMWLRFGGIEPLARPIDIYGPGPAGALPPPFPGTSPATVQPENPTPGLSDFVSNSIKATAYDINIRMRDQGWPDIRDLMRVHELDIPDVGASPLGELAPPMEPFVVMEDDRVKVTAILVKHPPVFPSFAYRFDTAHGSVVFSGDTTICDNTVTLAQGAKVLVHEAMDVQAITQFGGDISEADLQHLLESHSDVTKLGALAQRAKVKTLVLNHLAPGTTQWPDLVWKFKAQRGFTGRVIVGHDQRVFTVK